MIDSKRRRGLIGFMQGIASGKNVLLLFGLTIVTFPDLGKGLVSLASGFTLLKSAFSTASFLLLIIGFAFLLKKRPATIPQVEVQPKSNGQKNNGGNA
jgi:hypothetical protein